MFLSVPESESVGPDANSPTNVSFQGRWKIAALLITVACLAQAILWYLWWEDPTHFKMSLLFVWPATLFSLLVWWMFYSGWSAKVRYRSVAAGFISLILFFTVFRLDDFDGDMVPTKINFRWAPLAHRASRQFVEQAKSITPIEAPTAEPLALGQYDWPGFRGPLRDGIVRGTTLRADWERGHPKELWRHPVGHAWSSFAVVGDFAFTQEQRQNDEAVVAYRLTDGQQIWQHLDKAIFSVTQAQGGIGPRATPQFHEGKLYTLGATGILNCLDPTTGKCHWTADILLDAGTDGTPAANLEWGMAGSPLVIDQWVIVNPGGTAGKSVAAYDKDTGKKVWAAGKHPAGYASPIHAVLQGERVILIPQGTGLAAHALSDGHELWFFLWGNSPQVNSALPVVLPDETILFGTGYGVGTVRLEIVTGDKGLEARPRWQTNRFRPKFNDFIVYEGHIYGLDDGTLSCVDVETGKIKWKSGRYGYGQILLVNDVLLILSEEGTVVLVPATPTKPDEIARFPALKDAITWNHPVLSGNKLLIRNGYEAACFDLE